ncbi:N-acyl-D-aspartate/D-glutamate deacylase [Novosphingobium hassiacum]|uniref:N-acyl-D-aspartate/D-glutamate deacylase n=1 Tax=Novosphingobium hassiacum TaxID=173676 RepID=A0A7W5ZW64_9SPHN|nr:amidohydrolase family protein [Novosphingobium hassiacum]MBB3860188.1 N-acyl-D-aspartate/D-glutamate deacylase [Novosphingobium hassiacum]
MALEATEYDIVIRNGLIADGLGGEPVPGDVAVLGDKIERVGLVLGRGREEIDATGLLVTPGFLDIHTHFDAQAIWESRMSPASEHGVTTVVFGNCGVGFAPCRERDRDSLITLMEGVEDIPEVVMAEGLTWEWETYPQFLDAVASRPHDVNMASYLPHAPLRLYVMGDRASAGEVATPEDRATMARIAAEAMKAGAIGFATSRSLFHRSANGEPICTQDAEEAELLEIAQAMGEPGSGVLQVAVDFGGTRSLDEEFGILSRVARTSGQPLTLPIAQIHSDPDLWRRIMDKVGEANASGANVCAQALPRGIGVIFGLDLSAHPFFLKPSYREIADLPMADRVAALRDPARRARILTEGPVDCHLPVAATINRFEGMYEIGNPIDYEPVPESSIVARAAALGITPEALAYDILVAHGGEPALYMPFANYAAGNLDVALEMLRHPDIVLGLGDGGAHYAVICDASYPTFLLTHWVRDRVRGERIGVPEVIRALSHDTAKAVGLDDRGVIAPGYAADINLLDLAAMRLPSPRVTHDLPKGGRRLSQRAEGYVATIVNGHVTYRNGVPTGQLSGKLVRGRQAAPSRQVMA